MLLLYIICIKELTQCALSDPELFKHVLNYLRQGDGSFVNFLSMQELHQLHLESKFYCLDSLVKCIENKFIAAKSDYRVEYAELAQLLINSGQYEFVASYRENEGDLCYRSMIPKPALTTTDSTGIKHCDACGYRAKEPKYDYHGIERGYRSMVVLRSRHIPSFTA